MTDVIQLAQKLVRFQSFGGQIEPVFDYLHAALSGHGFNVRLLDCTEAGPSPVLAAAGEGKAVCCLPDILTLLSRHRRLKTVPLPEK
ncbi:MAG: hypothetical protein ACLSE6_00875 [Alphaproteobacteria bacterium]